MPNSSFRFLEQPNTNGTESLLIWSISSDSDIGHASIVSNRYIQLLDFLLPLNVSVEIPRLLIADIVTEQP
jgi:hypothetical protein